jgi:hypothetical protein
MNNRQPERELTDIIKQTAAAFLLHTEPTSREVGDKVIAEHGDLIQELGLDLATRQVYQIASRCMKSALSVIGIEEQFFLPLDLLGVPSAISFPCGDDVRFVSIGRAKKEHLLAYIILLQEQIAADSRKLNAVQKLYDELADIFAANPNLTVAEASAIYRSQLVAAR